MAILPYSDPSHVSTVVGTGVTFPYSDPSHVNTLGGVPEPLPPFSDPSHVSTQSHHEWQLPVTGSTVNANLTAPVA